MFGAYYQKIKKALVYESPAEPDLFVLDETPREGRPDDSDTPSKGVKEAAKQLAALLRYGRRLEAVLQKLLAGITSGYWLERSTEIREEVKSLATQWSQLNAVRLAYETRQDGEEECPVSTSLQENRVRIEALYQLPLNKDIVIRLLEIPASPPVKTMLVFLDGMVNKIIINLAVMQPLMLMGRQERNLYDGGLVDTVLEQYLPSGQARRAGHFREVQEAINSGDTVLFFDGVAEAVTVETKGFEHRSIDRPVTEQSVRGSQNAFTEVLRVNTALVRTMLHSSDLVTEMIPVGKRGKANCALMYVKSIANPALVAEAKRRIKGIDVDIITDTDLLQQYLVDFPKQPFPQTLSTERPERVAVHLAEGRVAILLDGSPFAQVVPISLFSLIHAADDFSLGFYYVNFLRIVRIFGAILSLLLPGVYLAISTFHQEAIPTDLLLAITAARSQVPFPTILEILLMELSFELIREGGLRIPGMLGSTIGIVGAIILGQAAVTAKLVSPIMVIIIAVTGLAAYSIPDYRLAAALRILRFVFVVLGLSLGLIGIACGLFVLTAALSTLKSFGVPYLAPLAPKTIPAGDVLLRTAVYTMARRPDELNPLDQKRQGLFSRLWRRNKRGGGS